MSKYLGYGQAINNNLCEHVLCFCLSLFNYSCPDFSLITFPHPVQPTLPQSIPTLLSMYMCPLYMFFNQSLPLLSHHYPSPHSPLVTVSLFFIFMSLVSFCLFVNFVHQVPLIGEIIWHLSFTAWLISRSITLSRRTSYLSAQLELLRHSKNAAGEFSLF